MVRFVIAWLLLFIGSATAQERVDLPSRPGVTEPIYLTTVANPKASIILFPGGIGLVSKVRNNFLLRVAPRFTAVGMTVAVFDAPSDHPNGIGPSFRATPQHAADIAAAVALLKSRSPAPVWLIGTSNGSISAAKGAVTVGPPKVAGVVLTSSVWEGGMLSVPLAQISVPVLVVHNRDDSCRVSPYGEAASSMALMQRTPTKELLTVSGGMVRGDPCEAMSQHGYLGIEDQVVPAIIAWIEAH